MNSPEYQDFKNIYQCGNIEVKTGGGIFPGFIFWNKFAKAYNISVYSDGKYGINMFPVEHAIKFEWEFKYV